MDFPFSGASEVLKSEFDLLEEESLERPDTETEEEREDGLPDHDGDDPDRGRDLTGRLVRVTLWIHSPLSLLSSQSRNESRSSWSNRRTGRRRTC